MIIRNTRPEDLEAVLGIYAGAREFMRTHGNPTQWGTSYPDPEQIRREAEEGVHFVCEENGILHAAFSLIPGEDPTYGYIEGAWLNSAPYATLHRVASAGKRAGMMDEIVNWSFAAYGCLRGDTHHDNLPMQKAFERCGFEYCGVIYVADGSARKAYHKIR